MDPSRARDLIESARSASSRAWFWISENVALLRDDLHKAHQDRDHDHIAHKAAFEIYLLAQLAQPSLAAQTRDLQIFSDHLIDKYLELTFKAPASIRVFGLLIYLYRKQTLPRRDLTLLVLYLISAADGRAETSIVRKMDLACVIRLITGNTISVRDRRAAENFLAEAISPSHLTAEYLYNFTHIAFYLSDLATKGIHIDDRATLDRVRRNTEEYAEYTIKVRDYDLLAELIICAELLHLREGRIGSWISLLISAQNSDGSFDRFPDKKSGESGLQLFYSLYHPTIVAIWAITMWRPLRGKGWRRKMVTPTALNSRRALESELRNMTRQLVVLHRSPLRRNLPLLLDVLVARHLGTRKQIPTAINRRGHLTPADFITLIDVLSSYDIPLESLIVRKQVENACRLILRNGEAAEILRFAASDILRRKLQRMGGNDRRRQFFDALLDRDVERVRSQAALLRRTADFKDIARPLTSFLIISLIMLRRLLQEGVVSGLEELVRSLYCASTLNEFLKTQRHAKVARS
jgi:hypothetical protein